MEMKIIKEGTIEITSEGGVVIRGFHVEGPGSLTEIAYNRIKLAYETLKKGAPVANGD